MTIDSDRAQKPFRKLRRQLKHLHKDLPPEEVHKLRTRARHIEAIAPAFAAADEKQTRRLFKSIKPIRKAAAKVRDMDVLTRNALNLPRASHSDSGNSDSDDSHNSLVRLVEHLAAARQQDAEALLDVIARQRKKSRHRLKQYAEMVQATGPDSSTPEERTHAVVADLMRELRRWPPLGARNIHRFRLKVKVLRSVLQILTHADTRLLAALGNVKDQIGEWHDWQQLAITAAGLLDPQQDRALLSQIRRMEKQKLREALTTANTLRARYLKTAAPKRKPRQ